MPVETANSIAGLDASWPLGPDKLFEGDNHIRLVKNVLKLQFPGSGGDGFAAPITATEVELNYSVGLTSGVQGQIDGHDTRITTAQEAADAAQATADEKADKTYVDDTFAVKISTDTVFGGFRHTFVDGVLNLMTTEPTP